MPEKVAKRIRRIVDRTPLMTSRSLSLRMEGGRPATLDESSRSVEVVASTEAPVEVLEWETWKLVREVLLMSGCRVPASLPLINTHNWGSITEIIGSFREIRIEEGASGPELIGRAVFSATEDGETPYRKVVEGHITDVSIGYAVLAHIRLRENESTTVNGRVYDGPLRLVTDWAPRELSLCPVGADENAKVRALTPSPATVAGQRKEKAMPMPKGGRKAAQSTEEKRAGLVARLKRALGLRADEDEKKPKDEEGRADEDILNEEEVAAVVDIVEEVLADELPDEDENGETRAEGEEGEEDKDKESRGKRGKRSAYAVHCDEMRALRSALRKRMAGGARRIDDVVLEGALAALSSDAPVRAAERARIASIRSLAGSFGLAPEAEEKLISSGVSVDMAKAHILDIVSGRAAGGPGFHVSQGRTEQEKFGSAVRDALCLRTGARMLKHAPGTQEYRAENPTARAVRDPAPGAQELLSLPLPMLCREMLMRAGERINGDMRQIVGRALTTTDLPNLLVETSHRILLDAFDNAPETWAQWALKGQVADFKKTKAVGFEGDVRLLPKPENYEYEEGVLAENAEEFAIATFGRKMSISRESLINDDLNALSRLPVLYGQAAAEKVGDTAYNALLNAPPMGDDKPLFHVDHNNLYAGRGGVPTVANLGEVVTGMKLQKDSFGKTITILPKFFLAPVSLEVAAEQFFNTQLQGAGAIVGTQSEPFISNPYGGTFFTRVYDRRLDAASATTWYLAARDGTVVVFFLGGIEAPYIESQPNFDTDGVESKVRMDVGAKAVRWVTLAKATAA
jgi:hypothetical protein